LADVHRLRLGNDYFLILGADCLPDFPTWREPERIVELSTLLVAARPGWPVWSGIQLAAALGLADSGKVHLEPVLIPQIEISSRDLRRRASEGRSVLYLVPRAVEVYIREKKLYI
jgi:nicotinate-nucleotide adenylyltransferase